MLWIYNIAFPISDYMSETDKRAFPSCIAHQIGHIELGINGEIHSCCFYYLKPGETVPRGDPILAHVRDNRFPAAEIAASRMRILQEIQAGTHYECCDCPMLATKQWPAQQYLIGAVTMNVWTHCNLKCSYCFTRRPEYSNRKVPYNIIAVVSDMLQGHHVDPAGRVTWEGGDISALPEFNLLAQLYSDYGLYQEFKTSAFAYLPGVQRALSLSQGAVEISLDAGTTESYRLVKGRDAFDRVVTNCMRYRADGALRPKYIGTLENLEDPDIEGFAALVEQIGPDHVIIAAESNALWRGDFTPYHVQQFATLIRNLRKLVPPVSIPVHDPNTPESLWFKVHEQLANGDNHDFPSRR